MISRICLFCSKRFSIFPYRINTAKYCSRHCRAKIAGRCKKPALRKIPEYSICKVCGKRFKSIQQCYKGRLRLQKSCSYKCRRFLLMGKNHGLWKGGVTPINEKIRKSFEYNEWRKRVFRRDKWTCIICGYRSKGSKPVDIHADHIKPYSLYPKLRLALDNGRTLCLKCHKKFGWELSRSGQRNKINGRFLGI